MRVAALISQPMRASHCSAYLSHHDGPHSVLTSDPTAFAAMNIPAGTRVHKVTPPPELLPTARLARARWFKRALARARAGSSIGRWLERVVKKAVWRLRYVDRLIILVRRRPPSRVSENNLRVSSLYQQLAAEHAEAAFDRIVAFDVFDLPVGLAFADDHGLPIYVR